jgi:hypothetical protein
MFTCVKCDNLLGISLNGNKYLQSSSPNRTPKAINILLIKQYVHRYSVPGPNNINRSIGY